MSRRLTGTTLFTTPEDLRARILHDVPELLKEIGAEVSGDLGDFSKRISLFRLLVPD